MDAKRFFYELGKAIYHIDATYKFFAKASGVASSTLLWILYALNDGKNHTQREICSSWDLPKSTVNTVMMELKNNGYVKLTPIKGKRREMTVVLTESGKAYAEQLLANVYQKEKQVFQSLNDEDFQITESLRKISALLRKDQGDME